MPPPRPSDLRNPARTGAQADRSKRDVALNRKAQQADWQRRLARDAARIERGLADAGKLAKEIAAMEKRREDTHKALERLVKMIGESLKEIQTFREVQVPAKLPDPPKNTIALASILPVLVALLAYWKLLRKTADLLAKKN